MQEVEVPCAADTKRVEEEPKSSSVPEEEKTLTLDTDLRLPDANETEAGGEKSVDQSEKKISSQLEKTLVEESSTPLKGEPFSAPQVIAVENVKKWKTWLLTDSEVMFTF